MEVKQTFLKIVTDNPGIIKRGMGIDKSGYIKMLSLFIFK